MAEDPALERLLAAANWPAGKSIAPADLFGALATVANIAKRRGAYELAEQLAEVIADPDSPDGLYELGYALIEAGLPALAASVLWRCLALVGDSEEVVCELISALESMLEYADAVAILEERAELRGRSYLARYLYGFNAAMARQLSITREVVATLVPDSEEATTMRDTLAGMIERADQIAPRELADARDWYYVLTGSLLVQPPRISLPDSYEHMAFGLERLASLVAAVDVPCIYHPEGRANAALARAAAHKLGLSIAPWPAVGIPAPGLVIVYDMEMLTPSQSGQLVMRRPGQILYAHCADWTVDHPVTPDVITTVYRSSTPPTALRDPDETEEFVAFAAQQLITCTPEPLVDDDPALWSAFVERVWPPAPGPRSRMWAGAGAKPNAFRIGPATLDKP